MVTIVYFIFFFQFLFLWQKVTLYERDNYAFRHREHNAHFKNFLKLGNVAEVKNLQLIH
jgi:hypothetical protein